MCTYEREGKGNVGLFFGGVSGGGVLFGLGIEVAVVLPLGAQAIADEQAGEFFEHAGGTDVVGGARLGEVVAQ